MTSKVNFVVDDAAHEEDSQVPDDVKDAAKVVAVWGVKSIISCIRKKNKKQPKAVADPEVVARPHSSSKNKKR